MLISNETNELFTALSIAQGQLTSASKAKQGHGYKYADIAECINTAKTPLEENGLAITQMLGQNDQGTTLITLLTHKSGQYIGSEFLMEKAVLQGGAGKNPAQTMGASITYMRRYAYAAIIGMAQEDDDAAGVSKSEKKPEKSELLPDSPRWAEAIAAYTRDGDLNGIKKHMLVSKGTELLIKEEANVS